MEGRPGLIRVGTFYLTPYVHVGNIGLDTNVFYTPYDRHTDIMASGGPGLEVVRPFGKTSRFRLDGGLDYLYYLRTPSLRRWNGYGSGSLELEGVRTRFAIEERYAQTYSRPNYQVNARLQQETEGTRAFLRRTLGERFSLALFGERSRVRVESLDYLGTDLQQTMDEDRDEAGGELRIALSVKTKFVAGGEQTWHRFPYLPGRNGRAPLAYGGFRTDETALIAGSALAGVRWFMGDSGGSRNTFYADVDAARHFSPKTELGGRFTRDLAYSAFATSGPSPTIVQQMAEVYVDKVLVSHIYLRVFGGIGSFTSDGAVTLVLPGQGPQTQVRNDNFREAGAEVGYQFRPRVRAGVNARYTTRTSTFDTFGVQGLLFGFTLTYNPPQPQFR
ncbi:MAG TPA: hypothetical protein VMU39_17405 [Solirubrobacteraceae bacterium]|nr:hypothetical protein [Solirubrobacteraceae bacterium]